MMNDSTRMIVKLTPSYENASSTSVARMRSGNASRTGIVLDVRFMIGFRMIMPMNWATRMTPIRMVKLPPP